MPDSGLLASTAVSDAPLAGESPVAWSLPDARLAQITFEISKTAALEALPDVTSRPVPCYARLVVLEAPESPVGPFRLAALLAGARYLLFPTNALVEGVVDGPTAKLAANFGGPFGPGSVALERSGAEVRARVAHGAEDLARVVLPRIRACSAQMLRWDGWLGFGTVAGAKRILRYAPEPKPREAFLSKGAAFELPAALPRGHRWRRFASLGTISACYVEGPLTLSAPELAQVWS
jgi:hypothetical protein